MEWQTTSRLLLLIEARDPIEVTESLNRLYLVHSGYHNTCQGPN